MCILTYSQMYDKGQGSNDGNSSHSQRSRIVIETSNTSFALLFLPASNSQPREVTRCLQSAHQSSGLYTTSLILIVQDVLSSDHHLPPPPASPHFIPHPSLNTHSMSLPPIRREHAADSEQEPLLGQPGDNTQSVQATLGENLVSGTAPIAQAGAGLLAAYVAYRIFKQPLVLFSAHPVRTTISSHLPFAETFGTVC
jgi:hypothetical protein